MPIVNARHDGVRVTADSLIHERPASSFNDAFPIANGRIGAMVYGQAGREFLSLNDETLWAGTRAKGPNRAAASALQTIRQLIFAGEIEQADKIVETTQGVEFCQPYLPAGYLALLWPDEVATGVYTRTLALDDAVVHIETETLQRRYFTSSPAQQIVMECRSVGCQLSELHVNLSSKLNHTISVDDNMIILSGRAPEEVFWEDVEMATTHTHQVRYGQSSRTFAIVAVVESENGTLASDGETLSLRSFNDVTIRIALATDAHGADPVALCKEKLSVPLLTGSLFEQHRKSHQELYARVSLDLVGRVSQSDEHDPIIDVFMFNYARYLMISAARADTLPANLQGIWNEEIMPPWWSNYTCNINLQMNYWMAESCGLGECHEALVSFVESLLPSGRATAREHFGCGGWVLCHQTDFRRMTTPVGFGSGRYLRGSASWSMWPMGGAWLCLHVFDRFRYSQDLQYLQYRAFPIMMEAAEFLLDWLVLDPKTEDQLTTAPSTSPENTYVYSTGYHASVCQGSAMDIAITRSLFNAVLRAATIAGYVDDLRLEKIQRALKQLPDHALKADGGLSEFGADVQGAEEPHRHISQLFSLTPGNDMLPELYDGARSVLQQRGMSGTGWALAWKAKCWARLGEGDIAYAHLHRLLSPVRADQTDIAMEGGGVYPNMLTAHPPMQIDANFGFGAAVVDMIVQADEQEIVLLPALPAIWSSGTLSGVRVPGGGSLVLNWDENRVHGKVFSAAKQPIRLKYRNHSRCLEFVNEVPTEFSFERHSYCAPSNHSING